VKLFIAVAHLNGSEWFYIRVTNYLLVRFVISFLVRNANLDYLASINHSVANPEEQISLP